MSQFKTRLLYVCLIIITSPLVCLGTPIFNLTTLPTVTTSTSLTGSFQYDWDEAVIPIQLTTAGMLTVQTWSYGGGTNYAGNTIAAGGFAPALTLFYPGGTLPPELDYLGGGSGYGCNGRN